MASGAETGWMEPQTIGDAVIILRAYQYGIKDAATEKGNLMHSFDLTDKTVELLLQGLKEGGYDV